MSKYNIIVLDEVESTNAYALEFMKQLDDKTVIQAIKQTNGRGRYNRKWVSDDTSNLYITFILKPNKMFAFSNLTQYLSVTVCNILEKYYKINPSIKWPNDILVDGAKISGILAETTTENNKISGIALGLGLNVNMTNTILSKIDQKATSMYMVTNKTFDINKILKNICEEFFLNYDNFIDKGFKYIKNDYIKRCNFLGKKIVIREENKHYLAQTIDDSGLLIVKDEFNNVKKIMTGDVLCAV